MEFPTFLKTASLNTSVIILLLSSAAMTHADRMDVTSPDAPSHYVTLDQRRAQNVLDSVRVGLDPLSGLNPALVMAPTAISHGADVTGTAITPATLSAESMPTQLLLRRRAPTPDTPSVGIAVPRRFPIDSCQTITHPGYFALSHDLSGGALGCLTFSNTQDVTLDCAGHSISATSMAVNISTVTNLTLLNCTIPTTSDGLILQHVGNFELHDNHIENIEMSNSHDGKVHDNQLVQVDGGQDDFVQFADNQITGGIGLSFCSNLTITRNAISCIKNTNFYGVGLGGGHDNTVSDNVIDGLTTGAGETGYDDGILADDEAHDTFQNNTIKNNYDAGIEISGNFTNSQILNNTINNVANTGIFGSYESSWQNNMIRGNTVTDASTFAVIAFYPTDGYDGRTVYFQNNTFDHNTFHPGRFASYPSLNIRLNVQGGGQGKPLSLIASNNMIMNNNFGTSTPKPCLQPAGAFVDGGGNIVGGSNADTCN